MANEQHIVGPDSNALCGAVPELRKTFFARREQEATCPKCIRLARQNTMKAVAGEALVFLGQTVDSDEGKRLVAFGRSFLTEVERTSFVKEDDVDDEWLVRTFELQVMTARWLGEICLRKYMPARRGTEEEAMHAWWLGTFEAALSIHLHRTAVRVIEVRMDVDVDVLCAILGDLPEPFRYW